MLDLTKKCYAKSLTRLDTKKIQRKKLDKQSFAVVQPGKVERHSQSFWREAEMLSNLNHPNVLRFYGVVVESYAEPNVIGIMTEYMKGGSLAAFLR